jgi:alpha-tubulin suppressor-like RCC1 family protein
MVCRCRRSSTPYTSSGGGGYLSDIALMDPWTNLIPCCDADFITEGPWSPVFDSLTVQKQKSTESTSTEGSTYEWEKMEKVKTLVLTKPIKKPAGRNSPAPTDAHLVDSMAALRVDGAPRTPVTANRNTVRSPVPASPVYQPPTEESMMDFNAYDGEILPLPSFDYAHFSEGENDMLTVAEDKKEIASHNILSPKVSTPQAPMFTPGAMNRRQPNFPSIMESPEEKKDEAQTPIGQVQSVCQPFYHGIPIFLGSLSQIRVSKVSSHPLGAHVLLISEEALLFSYGLNNHGQLGIGLRSNLKDGNRGFYTTPTLITPLLENGGKAIDCAAGVDHSLVVVATEGRRIHKLPTNPGVAYSDHGAAMLENSDGAASASQNNANDSVRHHQLYGFGSNDFMKIGLVRARLADDGSEGDGEDILLPRRVALHCTVWPQQVDTDDITLPPQGIFDIAASVEHSAALVRRATGDIEVYMWGNATLGALGLPVTQDPDVIHGGLTQRPPSNANNIFPLPTVLESLSFRPHRDSPQDFPRQVSLGPHCSFVVMSSGRCMSFGFSVEGMLGHGYGLTHTMEAKEILFPPEVTGNNGIVTVDAGAYHVIALTAQGEAYSWGINSDDRLGHGTSDFVKTVTRPEGDTSSKENLVVIEWAPQNIDLTSVQGVSRSGDAVYCLEACAGYDSSMLVTRSGEVYSFGKRSGRLGKGEVATDVSTPQSLHGGLRLFFAPDKKGERQPDLAVVPRTKPLLKRILSDGAFCT